MIASAQTIRRLKPLSPFHERTVSHGMTYGLGPSGYDVRINENIVVPSMSFVLASTIERFDMPLNLLGVVHDKSSWARRGLCVQNTVIEPGWRGFLTLELTNHSFKSLDEPEKSSIILHRGMPIAQIIFHILDEFTNQPYAGKYQDQASGPQPALDDGDADW